MNRHFLPVFLLSALWSTSWPLTKLAGASIPPMSLVAVRLGVAALCLLLYMRLRGLRLPPWGRAWVPLAILAVIGNALPYTMVVWAVQRVPSGLSSVFVGTMPVWTVLLTHFFSHGDRAGERLNALKLAGALAGFSGIVLLVGPTALSGAPSALWGELVLILAALIWANATIYTSLNSELTPDQQAAGTALLATLLLLPLCLAVESPWQIDPPWQALAALLVLSLGATALGTLMMFRVTRRYGPTVMSMVMYLNPALALVWGWLFLGETLVARQFVAFAAIALGLFLVDRGRKRAMV